MKTSEYIEQVMGIKLWNFQKDLCDYMDENPEARIIIPRGRSSMVDLTTLYLLVNVLCKEELDR